jgi:hypothetical protein
MSAVENTPIATGDEESEGEQAGKDRVFKKHMYMEAVRVIKTRYDADVTLAVALVDLMLYAPWWDVFDAAARAANPE